jgi:predicted GNAT superfamily acetyltransferase
MREPAGPEEVLAQARRVAAAAAARAGVEVRDLHELGELRSLTELFDRTWASDRGSYLPLNLLRALTHAGGHASAALNGGRIVGGLFGFLGFHEGELALHSHLLAVAAEARGRGIGYVLKLHQRAWSLERGIQVVTWTFDPLVSRNCYLNLTRLGAEAARYLPHFYGDLADAINAGDESDRILAVWRLAGGRATAAAGGARLDEAALAGAAPIETALAVGPGDRPLAAAPQGAATVLCQVPADIEAIRRRDPALALAWRRALREALVGALASGYRVEAFLRSGHYVLRRPG